MRVAFDEQAEDKYRMYASVEAGTNWRLLLPLDRARLVELLALELGGSLEADMEIVRDYSVTFPAGMAAGPTLGAASVAELIGMATRRPDPPVRRRTPAAPRVPRTGRSWAAPVPLSFWSRLSA